ncbi:MAG TPA: hypothetical protein VHI50_03470 [Micromonosporaceae bacterium]|nr:hypothetical protein [Micromonosporaceae bacterium]
MSTGPAGGLLEIGSSGRWRGRTRAFCARHARCPIVVVPRPDVAGLLGAAIPTAQRPTRGCLASHVAEAIVSLDPEATADPATDPVPGSALPGRPNEPAGMRSWVPVARFGRPGAAPPTAMTIIETAPAIVPTFEDEGAGRKLAIICSKGNLEMAYPGLILANAALGEGVETQ